MNFHKNKHFSFLRFIYILMVFTSIVGIVLSQSSIAFATSASSSSSLSTSLFDTDSSSTSSISTASLSADSSVASSSTTSSFTTDSSDISSFDEDSSTVSSLSVNTSNTFSIFNDADNTSFVCSDVNVDAVSTYCPSCILIDSSTGKVLYAKNAQQQMFPASTTKIMTAILTLENCSLNEVATVSHDAVYNVPYSYSSAYLQEGEAISVSDLLDALLIPSANDAAFVLAEYIGGSVESFSTMMNTKASDLGCVSTNFVNPNGIHDAQHYSCAYDLAIIGRYAMQNSTFRDIVSKTSCSIPPTAIYPEDNRNFSTTNDLIRSSSTYYYPYCTGVKTGYTNAAKSCIVASAKKDDLELICVVLGGESTEDGYNQRNLDCKALFDYGFNNYSVSTIATKSSTIQTLTVSNGTSDSRNLNLLIADEVSALVPSSFSIEDLNADIVLNDDLKAPISAGDVVGKVSYSIDGIVYSSNLIAASDVRPNVTFSTILCIVGIIIILYLIFKITKPSNKSGSEKTNSKKSSKKNSKKGSRARTKSKRKVFL